jgi:Protein of unknown function (DUF4013)
MIDISHAVSFIFEDRKWVSKVALLAIFSFLSFTIVPFVLALGYMLQLAINVRQGLPRPLPNWDKWAEKFTLGGHIFLALLLYNSPLIFIYSCSWVIVAGLGAGILSGGIGFLTLCCALPFSILYTIAAWSMLATGVSEYMETGEAGSMYRLIHLWDVMRANTKVLRQWGLYATLVNLVLLILLVIPFLGWVLIGLFGFPVHGHLFGQFAHQLSLTNKPKLHKRSV